MFTQPKWWIISSIPIVMLSFAGLMYVIGSLWPDPNTIFARSQMLLFAFIFLGCGALTVPVTAYLNQRFAKADWLARDRARLLRQGSWVGLLAVLLAYLQLSRILNWTIALVLAAVFVLIETFLLTRE